MSNQGGRKLGAINKTVSKQGDRETGSYTYNNVHAEGRYMTKLYGYDRNDDGIMLNKRIY